MLLPPALGACTERARPAADHLLTAAYAGEYNWGNLTRKAASGTFAGYPESDWPMLALAVCYGPPASHLGNLCRRAVVRRGAGHCAFRHEADRQDYRLRLASSP